MVTEKRVFGFIVGDFSPTKDATFWEDCNWGPIMRKQDVSFDMLPSWMQEKASKGSFPKKVLMQCYEGDEVFVSTNQAAFLIEHGFRLTAVHSFVEFEPKPVLRKFFDKCYKLRVQGTEEKNKCLESAAKMTANSRKYFEISYRIQLQKTFTLFK